MIFKFRHTSLNRWNCFLALLIAVSTNHSLGEIVYKKQTITKINEASPRDYDDNNATKTHNKNAIQDIIKDGGKTYVSLTSPRGDLRPGSVLDLYRTLDNGQKINTGVAQVTSRSPNGYIAKVTQESTQESRILDQDYPEIMVGDLASPRIVKISRVIQVTPSKTVSFFKLFRDPNAYPETFELSEEGKLRLAEAAMAFRDSKLPTLLVEGHTNAEGSAEVNQVESYQRALTVRQFMINQLGFDPERIVAIGMGEIEPVPEPFLPDHTERARRIVLKAKGY